MEIFTNNWLMNAAHLDLQSRDNACMPCELTLHVVTAIRGPSGWLAFLPELIKNVSEVELQLL